MRRGKTTELNKQGWARGVGKRVEHTDRSIHPHMLKMQTRMQKTHAHTYMYLERAAAGESEATSGGKEMSGDIKQKDKTDMTTPSRTGSVVRPGN